MRTPTGTRCQVARLTFLRCVVGLLLAGFTALCMAAPKLPAYRKLILDTTFYAEGAAYADFNGDEINDITAGPFWYEGPDY